MSAARPVSRVGTAATVPRGRPAAMPDPRSPLVLDTRPVGRRAGGMREVSRDVAAPAGWEQGVASVPVGTPVQLELRMEAVMEGVLVTGTATLEVSSECGRCLDPLTSSLAVPLQELYGYQPDPQDPDQPVLVGDLIDLEDLLRDAVVLGLPASALCRGDCAGLCSVCGERLVDDDDVHDHEQLDPRWAALADLSIDTTPTTDPTPTEKS